MTMTNTQFAEKAKEIATKYKTSYMLGTFGSPCTSAAIQRFVNQYPENSAYTYSANRILGNGFLFDCCGLIKGILWDWNGNISFTYGGAQYASNGVPDIDANTMISRCSNVTTNLNNACPRRNCMARRSRGDSCFIQSSS